nr:hypothetical protein CFP56_69687 [Quercus suber]
MVVPFPNASFHSFRKGKKYIYDSTAAARQCCLKSSSSCDSISDRNGALTGPIARKTSTVARVQGRTALEMAHASVSSCVLAIIASYSGGLDVLKKARARRRHDKRSNLDKISHEELQLVRSLRQGPDEIGRQYHRSVQAAGDQVAVGDGNVSQNSTR